MNFEYLLINLFILVALVFELRASGLLGRHSSCWNHSTSPNLKPVEITMRRRVRKKGEN
jgi:hypothetical protein